MIEQRAQILAVNNDVMIAHVQRRAACERCAQGQGCGGGVFAKLAGDRDYYFEMANHDHCNANDVVIIGIAEKSVLLASILFYLLPLVALIVVAVLADFLLFPEWLIVVCAASAALAGLLLARWSQRHLINQLQPQFVRKLSADSCGNSS